MGVYSNVEVHPSLLPEKHRHLEYWQTKDVIDPMMSTLVITENGKLLHRLPWIYTKFIEIPDEELAYTGSMVFYTLPESYRAPLELICLTAKFVDGKLISIEEDV